MPVETTNCEKPRELLEVKPVLGPAPSTGSGQVRLLTGLALLALLVLFQAHYRLNFVVGESMRPTYHTGDLLLVDRDAYRSMPPRRGDIVVARYQDGLVVKRVVGLPGEEIEVREGALLVDGAPVAENYSLEHGALDVGRGRLMQGKFATLGDNRNVPANRAVHPIVTKDDIVGKVVGSICWWHPFRKAKSDTET